MFVFAGSNTKVRDFKGVALKGSIRRQHMCSTTHWAMKDNTNSLPPI